MRTLFLEYFYLKGNQGAIYAARTHINLFSKLSEEFTLVYPVKKGKEPEGIYTDKIKMIPVEDYRSKIRKFIDLCLGKVHRYHLDDSFFDRSKFDVVVFDSSAVSARLIKKFRSAGLRTITIHHNYQIEYLLGDCNKLLLLPTLLWTWIYERQSVRYSDLNLTLTSQDSELLRGHYDINAQFATLGVFDSQPQTYPCITKQERGHVFLSTGGLAAKQNEDSIIPFLKNCYPVLKEVDAFSQLIFAGRNPSKKLIKAINNAGATVIPSPQEMSPILVKGDYFLCPTDRGGGLKLKILDGLKYGMIVLTHEVSARGYEKMKELGALYSYNDIVSFRDSLEKAQKSKITHLQIQKIYVENFSFEKGVIRLKEILWNNSLLL